MEIPFNERGGSYMYKRLSPLVSHGVLHQSISSTLPFITKGIRKWGKNSAYYTKKNECYLVTFLIGHL